MAITVAQMAKLPQSFWREVREDEKGCWIWGGRVRRGYGDYRGQKAYYYSYLCLVGAPSDGLDLHHLCKNMLCVNPLHLREVTPKEHRQYHKTKDLVKKMKEASSNAAFRRYGWRKRPASDLRTPTILVHTNEVSLRLATA